MSLIEFSVQEMVPDRFGLCVMSAQILLLTMLVRQQIALHLRILMENTSNLHEMTDLIIIHLVYLRDEHPLWIQLYLPEPYLILGILQI